MDDQYSGGFCQPVLLWRSNLRRQRDMFYVFGGLRLVQRRRDTRSSGAFALGAGHSVTGDFRIHPHAKSSATALVSKPWWRKPLSKAAAVAELVELCLSCFALPRPMSGLTVPEPFRLPQCFHVLGLRAGHPYLYRGDALQSH